MRRVGTNDTQFHSHLMEKLYKTTVFYIQSSSWRWPWPKTLNDRVAFSLFVFGGFFIIWYEQVLIAPTYYPETNATVVAHWIFTLVTACQIYGNMFMIITTNTSITSIQRPSGVLIENWRYCGTCRTKIPPRSHHCVICDVCILKRDHHCWFAGYCIGHKNHRYYLVMLVYMIITAAFYNCFNYEFVIGVRGPLGLFKAVSFFMPHVGYIFGFYDTYAFLITTLSSLGFVILILLVWLLQIQLAQVINGQTRYERKKKILTYNLGWRQNLVDILGPRWVLVWILPWIHSPPPGDGITFPEKQT